MLVDMNLPGDEIRLKEITSEQLHRFLSYFNFPLSKEYTQNPTSLNEHNLSFILRRRDNNEIVVEYKEDYNMKQSFFINTKAVEKLVKEFL
jgi:hypothetical protein